MEGEEEGGERGGRVIGVDGEQNLLTAGRLQMKDRCTRWKSDDKQGKCMFKNDQKQQNNTTLKTSELCWLGQENAYSSSYMFSFLDWNIAVYKTPFKAGEMAKLEDVQRTFTAGILTTGKACSPLIVLLGT